MLFVLFVLLMYCGAGLYSPLFPFRYILLYLYRVSLMLLISGGSDLHGVFERGHWPRDTAAPSGHK